MKNIQKNIIKVLVLLTIITPIFSFAQTPTPDGVTITTPVTTSSSNVVAKTLTCSLKTPTKLADLFDYATCIINSSVIPLIFSLAVAMFVYGVVQYVINNEEEAKKAKGKQFMIWGIIALTVMVSVWGLVSILGGTFGITGNFIPQTAVTP